jgi:hypothetical protein
VNTAAQCLQRRQSHGRHFVPDGDDKVHVASRPSPVSPAGRRRRSCRLKSPARRPLIRAKQRLAPARPLVVVGPSVPSRPARVCHVRCPHWGQTSRQRGLPAAFQRTPPASQTERSWPQVHCSIQAWDSACMASAQVWGRMAVKKRWIGDILPRRDGLRHVAAACQAARFAL